MALKHDSQQNLCGRSGRIVITRPMSYIYDNWQTSGYLLALAIAKYLPKPYPPLRRHARYYLHINIKFKSI